MTVAANQGLIYVLSVVVIGGLVGAGALGYLVVAGFSQSELFGKGLAAGIAIVVLGIMLDRVTQAAARRAQAREHRLTGDTEETIDLRSAGLPPASGLTVPQQGRVV